MGSPSGIFGIIRNAENAVAGGSVPTELAPNAFARENPASDAVAREHYAKSPCIKMETCRVGAPRKGMMNKHQGSFEALKTVRRLNKDVREIGAKPLTHRVDLGYMCAGHADHIRINVLTRTIITRSRTPLKNSPNRPNQLVGKFGVNFTRDHCRKLNKNHAGSTRCGVQRCVRWHDAGNRECDAAIRA